MNDADIKALEERYGVVLPSEYTSIVLNEGNREKYQEKESHISIGLLFDRQKLEKENDQCREMPVFSDYWRSTWFAIHADGCGNVYFITTDPFDGKVYDYDHEQTFPGYNPIEKPSFESLGNFLSHLEKDFKQERCLPRTFMQKAKEWITSRGTQRR